MIEPYNNVINLNIKQLETLGFRKILDEEYRTQFSNDQLAFEIQTERYYVPSIVIIFIDRNGDKYSWNIIQQLIDPETLKNDTQKLKDIYDFYKLDSNKDVDQRNVGIVKYLKLFFEQLITFLTNHGDTVGEMEESLKVKYLKASDEKMAWIYK